MEGRGALRCFGEDAVAIFVFHQPQVKTATAFALTDYDVLEESFRVKKSHRADS